MSTLRESLDDYLAMRRALGFQLDKLEYLAGGFTDWLAERGQTESFTIGDAVAWARLPHQAAPVWWGMRLGAVRTFAAYQNARDPAVPVIPAGLLPATSSRAEPYIYSQHDLDALLAACPSAFRHGFVAGTMHAIVGLLAATGMRIGEALRLAVPDITADTDPGGGLLLIRASKHGADRLLPLDASTVTALAAYRDLPAPACPARTRRPAVRHQERHWLPPVHDRAVFPAARPRCRAAAPGASHTPPA